MKQGGKTWPVRVWRMAGLCALVLAAYSNSFRGELVFDNAGVIAGDARIRAVTADNLGRIRTEPYSSKTSSGLYRPLTTLSYLVNYVWLGNGTNPAGYHWVNLAIHAANTLLVYLLVALVLGLDGGPDGPAWATAALWGVHPLLTESVTNIVGRADLLAAFGVLAGLFCYIRRGSAAWLLAAQAIGIFSKESAIVLPGLMLLYDVTWPRRIPGAKRAMAYGCVLAPLVVFAVLRAQLQAQLAVLSTDNPLLMVGFFAARLRAIEVMGKYLGLFLWPASLSPDYSYNAVPVFGWQLDAVVAFALCAAAVAAVVYGYRARKALFFFLAFFFVALLPVSNLLMLIGSIMAERFVYLPSVGLAACAIAAIYALAGSRGAMVTAAVAVLCVASAARTYARNFDWENERSLWTSAVEAVPESAKAHYNLGTLLSDVPGERAQAISELEAALRINPDKADAHDNLGRLLIEDPARRGDAVAQWEAAVRIDPDMADAHKHLGEAFAVTPGRLPDAIAEFQVAARLQPDVAETHANLGTVLYQVGQLADSMAESQAAIRINPNLAEPHNTLGIALAQMGRMADAIPEFEAVLRIDPANAQASANLLKARAAMRASGPGERPR